MALPPIRHARTRDGVRIAFHMLGDGPAIAMLFPYHRGTPLRSMGQCSGFSGSASVYTPMMLCIFNTEAEIDGAVEAIKRELA